jgi:hypothetical protein
MAITSATPGTVFTFPGTGPAEFVVTPVDPQDLSASDALSVAEQANPELKMPADTVVLHGVLTDARNGGASVWAFRHHGGCEVPPPVASPTDSLCTRWVFLRSDTGDFVEARYSP